MTGRSSSGRATSAASTWSPRRGDAAPRPGRGARSPRTRTFQAWEGGGEYNVARGLRRCFGLRTALVTALADNPVGRLVEDLMLQGGVDLSYLRWKAYDGVGRSVRNGLNFTERGFGPRGGVGCSDRGHTAVSQLQPGDVDWERALRRGGRALVPHRRRLLRAVGDDAGGRAEAMAAARRARHRRVVRPQLPRLAVAVGRRQGAAREVNRALVPYVDVLFGNEEDFSAALGFELEDVDENFLELDVAAFRAMIERVRRRSPEDHARRHHAAHRALGDGRTAGAPSAGRATVLRGPAQRGVEILDRVGGGDSFASGLIYGLLERQDSQWALECGVAHGALAMTTPGDTTMATLAEVERLVAGRAPRVDR